MFNTSIEHHTYKVSDEGRYVKLIVLITLELVAFFGNLLFIFAVFYRRPIHKQTRTYIYLSFVSITNLGAAIFVIPFPIITLATGKWALGSEMCYFNGYMNSFWLTSCVYSITVLSVHKYFTIARPMLRNASYKPVAYRIFFTMILSVVVTTIPFAKNRVYFNPYTAQCAIKIDDVGYVVYIILSSYFIPTFINVLVYWRIFIALEKHGRRLRFTTFYNANVMDAQKRMMKTLYLAFMSFIFSWTPFFIYAVLYVARDKSASSKYFLAIAYMAGFSNSAFNPLLFIFRNLQIKNCWLSVFKKKEMPKLALVPSLSRPNESFDDDRRTSYFGPELNFDFSTQNELRNNFGHSDVRLSSFKESNEIEIKFESALEMYANNHTESSKL